jgi:hypothetical protein
MSDDVPFSASGDASLLQFGEIVMILELASPGCQRVAIARRVGSDRETVRRYIGQGLEPPRQPRVTQRRAFEPFLRQRLAAFPQLTGRRLHRELRGHVIVYHSKRSDRLTQVDELATGCQTAGAEPDQPEGVEDLRLLIEPTILGELTDQIGVVILPWRWPLALHRAS